MTDNQSDQIQWHAAFVGAMRCELGEDINSLEFNPEAQITEKPLQADLLIIKKTANCVLKSSIGKLLSDYNILEYKSPKDALGINALFQALTYACYYKSSTGGEHDVDDRDVTVMLIRNSYPRSLVDYLNSRGGRVEQDATEPGIYRVTHSQFFNIMILVSGEMDPKAYTWLNALRSNIEKSNYVRLIEKSKGLGENYGNHVKAVLSVVDEANYSDARKWREDKDMEPFLYQAKREGREEGEQRAIQRLKMAGMLPEDFSLDQLPEFDESDGAVTGTTTSPSKMLV